MTDEQRRSIESVVEAAENFVKVCEGAAPRRRHNPHYRVHDVVRDLVFHILVPCEFATNAVVASSPGQSRG